MPSQECREEHGRWGEQNGKDPEAEVDQARKKTRVRWGWQSKTAGTEML